MFFVNTRTADSILQKISKANLVIFYILVFLGKNYFGITIIKIIYIIHIDIFLLIFCYKLIKKKKKIEIMESKWWVELLLTLVLNICVIFFLITDV